jgi:hypothetical protein
LSGEKIYSIQRKHWVSLVFFLSIHLLIIITLVLLGIFLFSQAFPHIVPMLSIDGILLLLSFMAVGGMAAVMDWFFQFYIITNKRIIKIHFFRIQGQYFEEIFIGSGEEIAISRATQNIIFDMLGVEDIHIAFRHEHRLEPFTVEQPSDPDEIEKVLDEVTTAQKKI